MLLAPFDYAAPAALDEAVALIAGNPNARIIAGGLNLLPDMKLGRVSPSLLVDLRRIQDLRGIRHRDGVGGLRIGAMTTFAEIAANRTVREHYPALVEAIGTIGDAQVRNSGTIGGNLAARMPGTDLPAVALALDATLNTVGAGGQQALSIDQYLGQSTSPGTSIITSVDLPPTAQGTGSAYEKFENSASHYALCGVAVAVTRASDGTIGQSRVAVTGAADRAIRLAAVEAALQSQQPSARLIEEASAKVDAGVTFRSDLAASGEYRAALAQELTRRALTRALTRAGFR
ncbi:MAG: xanthine dehydrogenase family protein subunit M [Anaerolineae bacterium]